jgi:predicted PurR-regulated permease PerM
MSSVSEDERVPVRTIAVTIGMVLATFAVLALAWAVHRVLSWIVVSALLAVVLAPLVDLAERRLRLRRALATLLVFLVVTLAMAGLVTAFVRPLAAEGGQLVDQAPAYVEQARTGRGPVGRLVQRFNLDQYVQRNQSRLREVANRVTTPALAVLRSVFSTIAALVTVFVLTFLMVLQGPQILAGLLATLPGERREHARRVGADCARSVTGYVTGNLLISVIAGVSTYVVLWALGVPYRGVVALFVAFMDLIPLVGATIGAVVATLIAAAHSLPAALIVIAFFVIYQQLENHLLQPLIMSRTVQLSALTVLVSVLIGVELLGFLGALLAIPVAGIIHVITRDLWDTYRGRPKPEPTVGPDEVPASEPDALPSGAPRRRAP